MNDDRLKREIEEALAVEPSPHFAAQVRARVAESARPSGVWIRWAVPAAAFALVALVTAVLFLELKETVVPKPVETVRNAPRDKTPKAPPLPTAQPPATAGPVARPSPATAAEPEVLFDPREMAAFRDFVEGVREDRIDITKLLELQQAAARTSPIEEIALMPIGDVEPLVIESLSFGAHRIEGGSL